MPKFTSATAAANGRRGGLTTFQRHGREHMRTIGRRGYEATLQRHFRGDAEAMHTWLHRKGVSALDARMRQAMPWLRPIATDPGTPEEFIKRMKDEG